jgi:hypothetical protein
MTTQQANTIKHIEAQHEAERFTASQASREQPELDAYSVLLAIEVKLAEGRIEEAKAMAVEYRAQRSK